MSENEVKLIDLENQKVTTISKSRKKYEKFEDTIKYVPREKWEQFIQLAKEFEDKNRRRNVLIFNLLVSTGARIGEFSNLKVNMIEFENGMITFPKEITKTKNKRKVRVSKELLLDLKDYLKEKNIKSGFIFRNNNNGKLSVRLYQKMFEKYFNDEYISKKLNLEFTPHPHTCRHNHIIYALQKRVPINTVMQQVGHAYITTTAIYSRLSGEDIKNGYEGVDF